MGVECDVLVVLFGLYILDLRVISFSGQTLCVHKNAARKD